MPCKPLLNKENRKELGNHEKVRNPLDPMTKLLEIGDFGIKLVRGKNCA